MKKETFFSKIKSRFKSLFFESGNKQGYTSLPWAFSKEDLHYIGDPGTNSAWVYIVVDKLIKQFSRAPFQNLINGKVVESGPVVELFANSKLWEATAGWFFTENEAFWWFGSDFGGVRMPTSLIVLDPRRMYHYLEDKDGLQVVTKWVYYSPSGLRVPILPDEIIHFKRWNRGSETRGMSPFAPLLIQLITGQNIDIEMAEHVTSSAIPPGILKTDQELNTTDIEEIQEIWDAHYSRNRGRGKIAVVGRGVDFKPISENLEKYLPTSHDCRAAIAAAFGVPPRVIGLKTEATPLSGTDTEQEYLSFWLHTMIPMMNAILDTLKTDFYTRFRIREEPRFDWENLPEFAAQRLKQTEAFVKMIGVGMITVNEYREAHGLPKVSWGNTYWHSIGLIPEGNGSSPTQPKNVTPKEDFIKSILNKVPTEKKPFFLQKASPYTAEVKQKLTEAHNRGIMEREKKFSKVIKDGYFYKQRKMILELLYKNTENTLAQKSMSEKTINDINAFDWDAEADRLASLTEPYIKDAYDFGQEEMSELFDILGIEPNWDLIEPRILEAIEESGRLIRRITETDRRGIAEILEKIILEGLSTDQAAEAIREHYKTFSIPRSETIARTELNSAANTARYVVMNTSGIGYHEWAHSLAENERPDHLATNGQVVLLGQTFQPAGLTRPYEEGASAEKVVNCRCVTLPRPDYQEEN